MRYAKSTNDSSRIPIKLVHGKLQALQHQSSRLPEEQELHTVDQIMRLQSNIENALIQNKYTVGIFLDFSKAYDMLWIDGLLHKMIQLGIGGNAFRWIKSFLTQRTFQVKIGDAMSVTRLIENGDPQGSVISPLLFLIMINYVTKRCTQRLNLMRCMSRQRYKERTSRV